MKKHTGPGYVMLDMSEEVAGKIKADMVAPLVEAAAITVRDEIVAVMNESTPAGRVYRIPGTGAKYTASAPGQPPAERLSNYANSWKATPPVVEPGAVRATAYSDMTVGTRQKYALGDILEHGARLPADAGADLDSDEPGSDNAGGYLIEPRPHIMPGVRRAVKKIRGMIRELGKL